MSTDDIDTLGLPPVERDEARLPPHPTPGNAMVPAVHHHGIVTPVAFNVGTGRVDVEQIRFVERTAHHTMWVAVTADGRELRITLDLRTQFYSVAFKPQLTVVDGGRPA